jgi:hypothetical protein
MNGDTKSIDNESYKIKNWTMTKFKLMSKTRSPDLKSNLGTGKHIFKSDKDFISIKYKELLELDNSTWTKKLKTPSSLEHRQMANKNVKLLKIRTH